MSNLETVQKIYEAFGRGDIPFILDNLADDVEWDSYRTENYGQKAGVPWLQLRRGRDEVAEFFDVVATMEIYQFEVVSMMEGGNQVAVEVYLGCKYFVEEAIHLWTFNEDGKVKRYRHFLDTALNIAGYEAVEKSTAA